MSDHDRDALDVLLKQPDDVGSWRAIFAAPPLPRQPRRRSRLTEPATLSLDERRVQITTVLWKRFAQYRHLAVDAQ